HLAAVVLVVDGLPPVRRIRRRQCRELGRCVPAAASVRLRVAGRRSELPRLDLRRVAEVVVERAVFLARDDQMLEGRVGAAAAGRGCCRGGRPERCARHRHTAGACPLEQCSGREGAIVRPGPSLGSWGDRACGTAGPSASRQANLTQACYCPGSASPTGPRTWGWCRPG